MPTEGDSLQKQTLYLYDGDELSFSSLFNRLVYNNNSNNVYGKSITEKHTEMFMQKHTKAETERESGPLESSEFELKREVNQSKVSKSASFSGLRFKSCSRSKSWCVS